DGHDKSPGDGPGLAKFVMTCPQRDAVARTTMALKRSTVCCGQVLAVTVTVLFWMLGLPLESNFAVTKPSPPTGTGDLLQSDTVQPQDPWAFWMISGASPVFVNL